MEPLDHFLFAYMFSSLLISEVECFDFPIDIETSTGVFDIQHGNQVVDEAIVFM